MDENVVPKHDGKLLTYKRTKDAICSKMDATRNFHSKSEKDKYVTYKWKLKYCTNELIYKNRLRCREQTCVCQGGEVGWEELGVWG